MKGKEVLFSHKSDCHGTPQWLYDKLDLIYCFDLDPCCNAENQKCINGFGLDDEVLGYFNSSLKQMNHYHNDGLISSWKGYKVFVNPPYSETKNWVNKAISEVQNGCPVVVMLLPSRTGMKWFTEGVLQNYTKLIFIQGRLKFEGTENSAPFDSIIAVFTKNNHEHNIEVWSNK